VAREIAKEVARDLEEFAEAGGRPPPADPAFEEKLRERLWKLLRQRLLRARPDGEPLD
jgi:hypothetical protein